MHIKINLIFL